MNQVYPLTQLELRYTQILNFSQVIRELISPYLRLTTSFNITNQGKLEETIRINFEDDPFFIDCRWDRIIFVTQNDPKRYVKPNSTMKIFWEIVEKLSQLPSFGMFKHSAFYTFEIKIFKEVQGEIIKKFKAKYLTLEVDNILNLSTDIAIVLEKIAPEKQVTITYGAYSKNDIKKYNLFPFTQDNPESLNNEFGTLFRFQVIEDYNKFNNDILKKYLEEFERCSSQFII